MILISWNTVHASNHKLLTFNCGSYLQETAKGAKWGGVGVLHKVCDGSENGTADTTICPLHYRKEANTDEKFLTNSKCHKTNSSSNVNRNHT